MAPSSKRRKIVSAVEEVTYDPVARQEYLSGFRKRKQQRIKQAQQVAKEKERLQKIDDRRLIREQRKKDLEEHVEAVNVMVRKTERGQLDSDDDDDDDGVDDDGSESEEESLKGDSGGTEEDVPASDQEYVDEDKFTTVTIEPMINDDDGSPTRHPKSTTEPQNEPTDGTKQQKRVWTKKKPDTKKTKKKKFRYETKSERKATKLQQRAKNAKAAQTRRNNE